MCRRYALPNSRIMTHQPHTSGLGGQATDIMIHAQEIDKLKRRLNEIYVRHTKQSLSVIGALVGLTSFSLFFLAQNKLWSETSSCRSTRRYNSVSSMRFCRMRTRAGDNRATSDCNRDTLVPNELSVMNQLDDEIRL